ncbi:hypothetical protein [Actinopolyspora mortivallis]|uniref:hypothetical protein n=1 Tax=Actinopolyspora mortivallis TaxID=33906 RepID=UPI0015E5E299|nr:hypothetical protein [Actinopolyspora mortivallis]
MEILGIIGFSIAVLVTPVYLLLAVKGVRSLSDLRDLFAGTPYDRGNQGNGRR